jgi:hypothetical protein
VGFYRKDITTDTKITDTVPAAIIKRLPQRIGIVKTQAGNPFQHFLSGISKRPRGRRGKKTDVFIPEFAAKSKSYHNAPLDESFKSIPVEVDRSNTVIIYPARTISPRSGCFI